VLIRGVTKTFLSFRLLTVYDILLESDNVCKESLFALADPGHLQQQKNGEERLKTNLRVNSV
jgi:hypothetical protein